MRICIVFGGTGFIGSFFSEFLLKSNRVDKVYLADLKPVCQKRFAAMLSPFVETGQLEYVHCDVRMPIGNQLCDIDKVDLIANFAAIHREPGHALQEYYQTNLLGAENVCDWARDLNCREIIFTSSIAPYGPSNEPKSETAVPEPVSAYGGSKLVAEKIHTLWSAEHIKNRLTIVRPGVVFGPGEGGNVSRLVKATLSGYFFYMGNQDTRKAGTYVRELVFALDWVHEKLKASNSRAVIFNMTMSPAPSVSEYVDAIQKVAGSRRKIRSVPFALLYSMSFVIELASKLLGRTQPISPTRLKKVVKSNHIVPNYLLENNYVYKYSLESALEEWKQIAPDEWLLKNDLD